MRNIWLARLLLTLWMALGVCSPSLAMCLHGDGSLVAASSCSCAGCDEVRPAAAPAADGSADSSASSLNSRSCCTTVALALASPGVLRTTTPTAAPAHIVQAAPVSIPPALVQHPLPAHGRWLARGTGPPLLLRCVIIRS